jgi:CRP/FNR family cyclic AMP-dependent transcriptional regulator
MIIPAPSAVSAGRGGLPAIHTAVRYSPDHYPVSTVTETGPAADPVVRKLMAAHSALGALPEQDRAALLRWSRIRLAKRQEVISRQGDPAGSVVLVLEGYLKSSVSLADGGEVFLDIAGPGSCVGEMFALHLRMHEANVTALSPARLLMIDARPFRHTFDRSPEGLLAILRLANARLQRTTGRLLDIRARSAPARLAKTILYLDLLSSSRINKSAGVPLRLSQSELGVMAGMSRELVNKHLGAWRDAGWIRLSAGAVCSVDTAALAHLSGGDEDSESQRDFA